MKYVLAAIAGVWMADGVALLVAPRQVIARMRDVLALSPAVLRWEGVAICLGLVLLLGTEGVPYQPVWLITGVSMVFKGIFLTSGPERWRRPLLQWCLDREDVDYRFVGLWLCALAFLLLQALGWFHSSS
jgi:uncharacterized protein YjeT (DUF2065 family)